MSKIIPKTSYILTNNKDSTKKQLKIILIGRPNVGKSTFFNRLCNKKIAIVDDMPGVTRDAKLHSAQLGDLHFLAVDTAGWTAANVNDIQLQHLTNENTARNVNIADIIFFMVDGMSGINQDDMDFAEQIRKTSKLAILLVNKSEAGELKSKANQNDLYKLGFGDPIYISAMHSLGLNDLYIRVSEIVDTMDHFSNEADISTEAEENTDIMKVAIVGRPNVGKSTLFNYILGKQRSIVSEISGTTRDAISDDVEVIIQQQDGIQDVMKAILIDTAGMRKKNKVDNDIESRSLGQSITAIRRSHVVIVVMDAMMPFEKQDLAIAKIAINEGKGLIFAVNKIDLMDDEIKQHIAKKLEEISYDNLESIEQIPLVYLSALQGKYVHFLFKNAMDVFTKWNEQLSTSRLNKWLQDITTSCPPPLLKSRKVPINIKYITQKSSRPPTFLLFANTTKIPINYIKFLKKSLTRKFGITGITTRFIIKTTNNPYIRT